jgi:hypothetical protein
MPEDRMKYPMRLSTLCIAVAWIATLVTTLIRRDYLLAFVALGSIGYAFQVALYLRDQDYARRQETQRQMRAEKKEPHP